jgi:hypothetical protein
LGQWLSDNKKRLTEIEATMVMRYSRWYSHTWGRDFKNFKTVHLLPPRLGPC